MEQLKAACSRLASSSGAPPPLAEGLARAQRQLAAALKDNDFIYHDRIPEAQQLEPVARAAIAKALPPPERWAAGRDLFAQLVPLAVHQAQQASAARRTDLVNAEIDKLREATQLLNSILASLSLPACIEAPGGAGLPASIRDKAAAVSGAGGLPELQRLMAELPELLQRNKDILDEVGAGPPAVPPRGPRSRQRSTFAGRADAARGGGGRQRPARPVRRSLDAHRQRQADGGLPRQRRQVRADHRQRRARRQHRAAEVPAA